MKLEMYLNDIPIGKENAVTYKELCLKWHCSERQVRSILHQLSFFDNNDDYVIIRSSHGKGFYRTNDSGEIESYIKECTNRASNIFKTLKKARRVLKQQANA